MWEPLHCRTYTEVHYTWRTYTVFQAKKPISNINEVFLSSKCSLPASQPMAIWLRIFAGQDNTVMWGADLVTVRGREGRCALRAGTAGEASSRKWDPGWTFPEGTQRNRREEGMVLPVRSKHGIFWTVPACLEEGSLICRCCWAWIPRVLKVRQQVSTRASPTVLGTQLCSDKTWKGPWGAPTGSTRAYRWGKGGG